MNNQPIKFRSIVFKMAHAIRAKFQSWSECLKQAWKAYKLRKAMKTKAVLFSFLKKDGSTRWARGIVKPSKSNSTRKPNFGVSNFWDTDINEYRSFKIENLLTVK